MLCIKFNLNVTLWLLNIIQTNYVINKPNIDELNDNEFPIAKPQNNENVSNNSNEMQLIIPSTASLPLTQDHNSDSEQSQSEFQLSPTYKNQSDHK